MTYQANFKNRSSSGRIAATLHLLLIPLLVLALAGRSQPARAAQTTLTIVNDAGEQHYTQAELLARPDAVSLMVDGDVYHRTVQYRAVPLLALLGGTSKQFDAVEAQASDGFVSQIPLALVARGAHGGSVAWIAVEDPDHPWPSIPRQSESAGPFYLIWEHPERSGISREQWPYRVIRISLAESPAHRWPQLSVPAALSTRSPARHGQDVFVAQCLPCHQLNGGGASNTGPDLGRPMNATQYLTDAGLRGIIRNPHAVRTWPEQHMPGFDKGALPDADLDAVIAYLRAMAPTNR